jgi:NAD(P)-dependent dehydrogenase (short-subunit alcohol dehydrogenase family)
VASGTVLITGASTGIGLATAHHLSGLGSDAVGTVRRPEDAERLRSAGLRTVTLDVTPRRSSSYRSSSCAINSRST